LPAASPAEPAGLPSDEQTVRRSPRQGEAILGEPYETREQQVLRTLAAVRQWTAGSFPAGDDASSVAEVHEAPGVSTSLPQSTGPENGEIVVRAGASQPEIRPISPTDDSRTTEPAEPEVVNVTLTVGSIELTLEAPEAMPSPQPRPPEPRPGPAAAGAEAILRRHYVRPSVGW
jgi:hypothetical protein